MNMDFLKIQMCCHTSFMARRMSLSGAVAQVAFLSKQYSHNVQTEVVFSTNCLQRHQIPSQVVSYFHYQESCSRNYIDGYHPGSNSTSGLLPDLTGKITRDGKYPCCHGGFADVWKGTWCRDICDRKVCQRLKKLSQTNHDHIRSPSKFFGVGLM